MKMETHCCHMNFKDKQKCSTFKCKFAPLTSDKPLDKALWNKVRL